MHLVRSSLDSCLSEKTVFRRALGHHLHKHCVKPTQMLFGDMQGLGHLVLFVATSPDLADVEETAQVRALADEPDSC